MTEIQDTGQGDQPEPPSPDEAVTEPAVAAEPPEGFERA